MAISNFIPELWSTQVITTFRKTHVFTSLVNRSWEGEIRNAGDTVRITTPAAITVGAYSGTVSYQTPTSAQQSLLIDQDLYWAFQLDDVDQAQANVNLMQAYMQEAAFSLADTVDADIASLYASAGLTQIELDVGTDDFYDKLVLAGQYLDEANVGRMGRWVVISPKGYADLLQNSNFINATDAGASLIREGALGRAAGFDVLVSNNLVDDAEANHKEYLYGTNAAITMAEQVVSTEALRGATAFADQVRGRFVYGRKVVRPNALGVIHADET
ncbi:MAG TPA: P22 coat protein - protein 5 domain protein [Acidimicrobiia bacterium]